MLNKMISFLFLLIFLTTIPAWAASEVVVVECTAKIDGSMVVSARNGTLAAPVLTIGQGCGMALQKLYLAGFMVQSVIGNPPDAVMYTFIR